MRCADFSNSSPSPSTTRAACFHACRRFFAWCDLRSDIAERADIEPIHVAA
jgi:hypothetical protein